MKLKAEVDMGRRGMAGLIVSKQDFAGLGRRGRKAPPVAQRHTMKGVMSAFQLSQISNAKHRAVWIGGVNRRSKNM